MPSRMLEYSRWSIALIAIPAADHGDESRRHDHAHHVLRIEAGQRRNRFRQRVIGLTRRRRHVTRPSRESD
jgi:hypothetical protein